MDQLLSAVVWEKRVRLPVCSEPSWFGGPARPWLTPGFFSKQEVRSSILKEETDPGKRSAQLIWCMSQVNMESYIPPFPEQASWHCQTPSGLQCCSTSFKI